MDNQFVLRRADITDIESLSQLCQKTFRETFMENFSIQYPEKDLDSYFHLSTNPESIAKKINNPKRAVWVIEHKTTGELLAYAMAGPCDTDNIHHLDVSSTNDGAIEHLYVRRDQQTRGFGRQLMNVILPWLEEQYPGRPIWLTLWSQNFKAQTFYSHYGFSKVGDCPRGSTEFRVPMY